MGFRFMFTNSILLCAWTLPATLAWSLSSAQESPSVALPSGGAPVASVDHQAIVLTKNPILFVTQVPVPGDLTPVTSAFSNHLGGSEHAGRGGDLWLRFPDGTLRNLTREAGFGIVGFQGANSIAVREPTVHWSGARALFSMVVGAPQSPAERGGDDTYFWQIYEVTGLPSGIIEIERVGGQPSHANNTSPVYGSDDRVFFTSDRPRSGESHLYPQRDEYNQLPTTTGIWRLDPGSGDVELLNHLPSGAFGLSVDTFGRVVFSRWDHLGRDRLFPLHLLGASSGLPFNWSGEGSDSVMLIDDATEYFPEPLTLWMNYVESQLPGSVDDLAGWNPWIEGHEFDHFLPWALNQDGTGEETLAHVGRQELATEVPRARKDDPAIVDYVLGSQPQVANTSAIHNALQVREDPLEHGSYLAINAPHHRAHASGQLVRLRGLGPDMDPNLMTVDHLTHADTFGPVITTHHTGRYRNPVPLSDGQWIASHSHYGGWSENLGTAANPQAAHAFRLVEVVVDGGDSGPYRAGRPLTGGIEKSVQYWTNDLLVSWSGELWELDAAEVVVRSVPPMTSECATLPSPESQVFDQEGVDPAVLRAWLAANQLALIVSRDVTARDMSDRLQPFNLRIAGTTKQTIGSPGDTLYDAAWLQIFQADQVRGLLENGSPLPGRRVLPRPLHEPLALAVNGSAPGAPPGSVALGPDGSMAAVVPARRALTWQTTDPQGEAVVRERYWLTFQPGEIRVCGSCHGVNQHDQAGNPAPQNPPEALRLLIGGLTEQGAFE